MKKTAVEWLIQEHFGGIENCTPDFRNKIEQAKEMEKEQIMLASGAGYKDGILYANGEQWLYESPEQYYNETYKQD